MAPDTTTATTTTTTTCLSLSEAEKEMLQHIIDLDVLEDLKFSEEMKLSECIIYKVPCNLRKVKEEAYTPQLISIGPIHFDKEELKPMQEHKQRYFHFFWQRVSNEQVMKDYKLYLESKEKEIRQCYAQNYFPEINKDKFIGMILLDAVFIMELFLRNSSWKSDISKHEHQHVPTKSFRLKHRDDQILTRPWLSKNITRDLILLENQIPFFVLNQLYESVFPGGSMNNHPYFLDLALEYFAFYETQRSCADETKQLLDRKESRKESYLSSSLGGSSSKMNKDKDRSVNKDRCMNPKHFTDLIRYFYLPNTGLDQSGFPERVLRTATKLQESGITFEKDLKRRLLDIAFEKKRILSSFLCLGCLPYLSHFKARFRIPQLKVDHTTECVLRNLIAFEQCYYPEKPQICNYVSLIDSLIHTQVDVELLVEKEVIVHELGSDKEVATLVNGLCKHVVANSTCYYETINELNWHYQSTWNRTMAALWLVYFRDPWRASSTVVGIAVLIFAVFNFIKVLRYFH